MTPWASEVLDACVEIPGCPIATTLWHVIARPSCEVVCIKPPPETFASSLWVGYVSQIRLGCHDPVCGRDLQRIPDL